MGNQRDWCWPLPRWRAKLRGHGRRSIAETMVATHSTVKLHVLPQKMDGVTPDMRTSHAVGVAATNAPRMETVVSPKHGYSTKTATLDVARTASVKARAWFIRLPEMGRTRLDHDDQDLPRKLVA